MLIADDVLLFPVKGFLWIFNEICNAAEQELREESDALTGQLQQLYAMLETGKISETEFDRLESDLLDRLDAIQEQGAIIDDDE